jgi:RNA polymerase-binding transcription factor DksA
MSADFLDNAQELTEKMAELKIKEAREEAARIDMSNSDGHCWFCDAEIGHERRWCNAECRDGYELEQWK